MDSFFFRARNASKHVFRKSTSKKTRLTRQSRRRLPSLELLERRDVMAAAIVIGNHFLLPNTAGQEIQVLVSGDSDVSGFNLRAQLGDGSGPIVEPVFGAIDFDGGIWDAFAKTTSGGPLAGTTQRAEASVAFSSASNHVVSNGLVVTLVIDTTGITSGTFDLLFSGTQSTSPSNFVDSNGSDLAAAITNGSITVAANAPPVNTVPGAQTTDEDTSKVFSTANGNLISVADADAGSADLKVTLAVTNGTLTLGSTTGLTFSTGDGTTDATMTFTGTLTELNAAINGLSYNPTQDFNGAATLTITTDDLGNTGAGGALSDTDTVAITVTADNDAPVNTVPAAQTTAKDSARVFSAANGNLIEVADADADSSDLQVTLGVTNGTLTLGGITGLSFTTGDGTSDTTMTFAGTLAEINAALSGLSYNPTAGFTGSTTLTITTNDQGNTGTGGALSDTDTVAITVQAANAPPVNTVPAAQTTTEDTPRVFSSANGNLITVADADAGTADLQVTLAVTNGTLTLGTTTGLSFTTGDGTADATMTFTGTLTELNAALSGLSYNPTAAFNGAATLTITTNDQGNTGTGGALSDTDTVAITVTAVNDAPINTFPAAQTMAKDTARVFSSANGNLISVADVDADSSDLQVTLTVTNGTLTLGTTTGLSFTTGDGTSDTTMTFAGTLAEINAALSGLSYNPTVGFTGTSTLTITTNDQGNTGSGGALSDTDTVAITVQAANVAPVNTVPATQTTAEDTARVFSSANGNLITVADVDAGTSDLRVTLGVTNGTLTLGTTTGLAFTTGDGTADSTMTFVGTLAEINAALSGLSYNPTAAFNGSATLTITTNDQGNTGSGGALSDTDTVAITVSAVNDAPVNTVPGTQSTAKDTARVFSTANGNLISVADVDAGTTDLRVTLGVTNGTLTLSTITGLSFTTGDGTADSTMTFAGTLAEINAALNGLRYNPTVGFSGAATLTITTNDQGNTGTGGALSDSDTVALSVTSTTPKVSIVKLLGRQTTGAEGVVVKVKLDKELRANSVGAEDFQIIVTGGIEGAKVLNVNTVGRKVKLVVATGDGSGTLRVGLSNLANILDQSGNAASLTVPTGQAFTIKKPSNNTVEGTESDDTITVRQIGRTNEVLVTVLTPSAPVGSRGEKYTMNIGTDERLIIKGLGGNDTIDARRTSRDVVIYGGNGNDALFGGKGRDLLLGEAGNDALNGGGRRDMIIGGAGLDSLTGGTGGRDSDDLLIGDRTQFDAQESALLAILREWASNDSYAARVSSLRSGADTGGIRLTSSTVLADGSSNAVDQLFGGPGQDWFWNISGGDSISDRIASERIN